LTPDHQPSIAAVIASEEARLGKKLSVAEKRQLRNTTTCIEISGCIHSDSSRTYKGRNNQSQIQLDSIDLEAAANRDGEAMRNNLLEAGYTKEEIDRAFELRDERNKSTGIY
jgi:hypothetical protein